DPPSVSGSSAEVVVVGSASATQVPALASVPGPVQSYPSSVPSKRPSSSLSGSSGLIRPSPSVSSERFGSSPSGTPSSSLSASSGSVPSVSSVLSDRPSPSLSTFVRS